VLTKPTEYEGSCYPKQREYEAVLPKTTKLRPLLPTQRNNEGSCLPNKTKYGGSWLLPKTNGICRQVATPNKQI
jgi:hypothetical protein